MTITICDRCGKETRKSISISTKIGTFLYQNEKLFDLCPECLDEFYGFMKQEKESASAATDTNSTN